LPEERAQVRRLHGEGWSRNAIARELDRSLSVITRIARGEGLAFDREATKAATAAAVADNKAVRALLSRRFLQEAERVLDRLNGPYLVYAFGGKDNDYNDHELKIPPAGEVRNLMTAAAVAFDKHMAADRHDADSGAEGARSVLGALALGIGIAAAQIDGSVTPVDE
jgi:hypothetical protein